MTRRTPAQYVWERLEFNDRLLKKHFTPLPSRKIYGFTVHHMTIRGTGNGDALDACYRTWQTRQASAHYGVDGQLVDQFVLDKDYAWATGSARGNLRTISVEFANSSAGPKWLVDNMTVVTGARLIANGHVLYKLGRPVVGKTLFEHDDWFATACPGPYLGGSHWPVIVAEIVRVYDQLVGAPSPVKPVPLPKVAVWGKPETWVLGATGSDVTRLGERIRVWSKALGLRDPYKVGPGEPYGPADVAGLQALQVAWGYGDEPADLQLGGASDGYPGELSFAKLASTPPKKPATPAKGQTVDVRFMFVPMAGYNGDDAKGVTAWKANTDGLASLVKKYDPDLVGTTELSNREINPMRPRFDQALPDYSRRLGGSDGRFVYGLDKTTERIASGHVNAAKDTLLNGDDKQAAWSLDQVGPIRVATIAAHTENQDGVDSKTGENADDLRVEQLDSMVDRAIVKIKAAGGAHLIVVVADTNSEDMVRDNMADQGWHVSGGGYFTRWDDSVKKRFDYALCQTYGSAELVSAKSKLIDHDFADHTAIVIDVTVRIP